MRSGRMRLRNMPAYSALNVFAKEMVPTGLSKNLHRMLWATYLPTSTVIPRSASGQHMLSMSRLSSRTFTSRNTQYSAAAAMQYRAAVLSTFPFEKAESLGGARVPFIVRCSLEVREKTVLGDGPLRPDRWCGVGRDKPFERLGGLQAEVEEDLLVFLREALCR